MCQHATSPAASAMQVAHPRVCMEVTFLEHTNSRHRDLVFFFCQMTSGHQEAIAFLKSCNVGPRSATFLEHHEIGHRDPQALWNIVTSWHRETQALAGRGDNFILCEKCFRHKERSATNNESMINDEHANERCMTDRVPVVFTVRNIERANTSD